MRIKTSQAGNKGFTLFELIVVLFIVGMTMAVVIFSAARMHDSAVFSDEVRRLYQTMRHAREMALMGMVDVTLKVDKDSGKYWLVLDADKVSDEHQLRKGYSLEGDEIVFFPKGNSSGGRIKIKNEKGKEYAVEVDRVLGTPSIKRL